MKNSHNVNRRSFLKVFGLGAAATGLSIAADEKASCSTLIAGKGKMDYRTNPTSKDVCSLLGYGCMRWPMKDNPEGGAQIIDQAMVNELVDTAMALGVNYYDTAPMYIGGHSEEATGIALKRHPRDKFFVATKLSTHGSPELRTLEKSKEMYYTSLKRLQVDYIDYYLIHCVGLEKEGIEGFKDRLENNGMLKFLLEEKAAGRIRNLGFSYHGNIEHFNYALQMPELKWDFVQIQLNYIDWKNATGMNYNADYLYNELEKRNIPVVIMEPLRGGALANIPQPIAEVLRKREPEQSIASWAFRYAGTRPGVLTVLSGMTYMNHLEENLRTYSPLKPLTAEEMTMLEGVGEAIAKSAIVPCTACQYCMPCPHDVDIPGTFIQYNACVNEEILDKSDADTKHNQLRKALLNPGTSKEEQAKQAKLCVDCGECLQHCPQNIKIPSEMERIVQFEKALRDSGEF